MHGPGMPQDNVGPRVSGKAARVRGGQAHRDPGRAGNIRPEEPGYMRRQPWLHSNAAGHPSAYRDSRKCRVLQHTRSRHPRTHWPPSPAISDESGHTTRGAVPRL